VTVLSFVPFVFSFVSFVSFVFVVLCTPVVGSANERSRELTAKAFDLAYNLDHAEAIALLDQAVAADPNDPDAHRAIAVVSWLHIGFLRGSITVDDYLGSVSKPNINMTAPPTEDAQRYQRHITRALQLSEAALVSRPNDPDAHFRLGSTVGVQASYGATIEGRVLASFRSARRAYDAHERVLELAPARKDAGLIVGTYRYIVATLALPMRLMAYVAGFGGGRERGLRMIEEAAEFPGVTQVEARLALLLLDNREKRYDEAMRVVRALQQQFPRNRLLWLEGGATLIRASRYQEAAGMLDEGLRRLEADTRERMFGEETLWRFKRGFARARLGQRELARADFARALAVQGRPWVQGRVHTELGRLADADGDRKQARTEYRLAIELATRGNDPAGKAEAQQLLAGRR